MPGKVLAGERDEGIVVNRRIHVTLALGLAVTMALWAITELTLVRGFQVSELNIALALLAWSSMYMIGARTAAFLVTKREYWRAPYLVSAILILAVAVSYIAENTDGIGIWLRYLAISLALGIYLSSSTRILYDVVEYEVWSRVTVSFRALSGILYVVFLMIIILGGSYIPVEALILLGVFGAIVAVVVALSLRRPPIAETVMREWDMSVDAIAFGDERRPYFKSSWSLGISLATTTLLRLLAIRESRTTLGTVEVLMLYALFYTLGAIIGARLKSPGLAALSAVLVTILFALGPESPIALSGILLAAGLSETGLLLHVLDTRPSLLARTLSTAASATLIVASMIATGLYLGLHPGIIALTASTVALGLGYERTKWA